MPVQSTRRPNGERACRPTRHGLHERQRCAINELSRRDSGYQRRADSCEDLLCRLQVIDFCLAQTRRQSRGLSIGAGGRWGQRALLGGRGARRSHPCFLLETAQQFAKAIGKRLAEDLTIESTQLRSNSRPDFVPTRRSRTHPKVSWSAMFDVLRLTRGVRRQWGSIMIEIRPAPIF